METTAQAQIKQPVPFAVEPDTINPPTQKKEKNILAVEVMNGIVFAVVLMLFGLIWGTFASVTFAGV
ncbi:MAG: hypothetical protein V1778_02040 [bacterium]